MSYRVGQVLYVILKKEASVYPMQVVKEVIEKTLDGEVTTYMLQVGADPTKTVAMNQINGEIYESSADAKKVLIDRVSGAISQRIEQAIGKAKEWYPSGFEHVNEDDPLSLIKTSTIMADQATQPAPKQPLRQPPKRGQMKAETAALAAELQQESMVMEVPDGNGNLQQVKVRGVKLPSTLS